METNEKGEYMVEHHVKYEEIHGVDETVWMTMREHKLLHSRLRREGKCDISVEELTKISVNAHHRTEKWKKYQQEHKEEILKRNRLYQRKKREKILEQKKSHYSENNEEILKRNKHYREENKEKIKVNKEEYYQKNKERIKAQKKEYREKRKKEMMK